MLGNFKKMFIDKPNTNVNIPSGILESLAYNLPAGFSYTDVGEGFCVLKIPDGTQIKGRLRLEGASIENLKKCKNFDDLVSYAVNIQKPIQLLPSEDGYYYIGDKPFSFEQFIKCPLKDLILKDGAIQYVPQKFEYELKMPMSVDEKKELVILKRVPFDSLKQLKFVSEENRGIVISVLVSVESPTMKINVATDFSNAGSVQNVCNSIFWFNSFANGKVKIFNELVNENNEANLTPYDNEAVDFWKQLLAIEKKFDVSFDVSNGVYERDVISVGELYRSLVDNKPFRKDEMITNLTAYDENKTTDEMEKFIGKELFFRFLKEEETSVMGVRLDFVGVKYIFGTKIKSFEYENESKNYCFVLEPVENGIPYTATQYFMSKKELEDFLRKEDSYKESFEKATCISINVAEEG